MMYRVMLIALVCIIATIGSRATLADTYGQIPGAPVYLGAGFNIIYPEKVYPSCISANKECQMEQSGSISCITQDSAVADNLNLKFAPRTTVSVREIKSKYDYFRELNISASVSGSYGIFSGSASYNYHSIDDIDEKSISFAVTAKSDFGSFSLAKPQIMSPYDKMPSGTLIDACGPQFVAQVDRGVLASILYTFHSRDENKLRETSASISAGLNAGVWDAKGGGSFKEFVKTFSSHGQVTYNVFAIGGEGVATLKDLIQKDPTELIEIKKILAEYVSHQDAKHSSILGFRTASFGKLIGKPEIDPDYTSYMYFLERINEQRLRLEDLGKLLDTHLVNQADFADSLPHLIGLRKLLDCELQQINLTASSCRLWTKSLADTLSNGKAGDDRLARILMTHGLYVDPDDEKQRGGDPYTQTLQLTSIPEGDADILAKKPPKSTQCEAKNLVKQKLASALSRFAVGKISIDKYLTEKGDPPCSYSENYNLISNLKELDDLPFEFSFSFDSFATAPNFPSTGVDVFYGQITGAAKVNYVQVFDKDQKLLKHEANSKADSSFGFAFDLPVALKGSTLRLVFRTLSGEAYQTLVDVPLM